MLGRVRPSMAALSYSRRVPFLEYLTLFQSRAAAINLVLPITGASPQRLEGINRKLSTLLKERTDVDLGTETGKALVTYLMMKKFIGKKGKYPNVSIKADANSQRIVDATGKELSKLSVHQIDLWMSDPRLPSVIGVPTADNASETVELCQAIGVVTPQSNAWTAPGLVAFKVRSAFTKDERNPFVFGPEIVVVLRQLIERDGLMLLFLMQRLLKSNGQIVRDDISLLLGEVASDALERAKSQGIAAEAIREGKQLVQLFRQTVQKRAKQSEAPGVLEHRTTPRLEWLTDLGALSKDGRAKNGFTYSLAADAPLLFSCLDAATNGRCTADDAALTYWRESARMNEIRATLIYRDSRDALLAAYKLLRPSIGPVAIRDLCLVAGMGLGASSVSELEQYLIEISRSDRGINLSGGRYKRSPEFVHITDAVLSA
jgi:hypothetical protein